MISKALTKLLHSQVPNSPSPSAAPLPKMSLSRPKPVDVNSSDVPLPLLVEGIFGMKPHFWLQAPMGQGHVTSK
jgi:hypothetical protein